MRLFLLIALLFATPALAAPFVATPEPLVDGSAGPIAASSPTRIAPPGRQPAAAPLRDVNDPPPRLWAIQWPTLRRDASALLPVGEPMRVESELWVDLNGDGRDEPVHVALGLELRADAALADGRVPVQVRLVIEEERGQTLLVEQQGVSSLVVEGPAERGSASRERQSWTTTVLLRPGSWFDLSTAAPEVGSLPVPLRLRVD